MALSGKGDMILEESPGLPLRDLLRTHFSGYTKKTKNKSKLLLA
jgi:hypothetical protein